MTKHKNPEIKWGTLLVAVLTAITFMAFLGGNIYTTKGEPREAIVALSMLQTGDWILPVTFGAEIPYKPPMLAWCVALLGWLNGGVITELLSRVPSALAAVIMLITGFRLYAHRVTVNRAIAMTLITAGSFEFFRNGTICRVDMLLTMFVVISLYAFYRQSEKHPEGTWKPSLWAVLFMSGGILTKGPVGMLLPCMVVWVFRLMRGNGFMRTTVSVAASAILSLILPAMWYIAAYNRGGEEFLTLVMEENFGRFTGTMSYASHENPAWYNLLTLAYGIAPYSLILLMSLFVLPWKQWLSKRGDFSLKRTWNNIRNLDPLTLYTLLSAVLIFIFYCIPKSKRSAYLLPVYPFAAYFITLFIRYLINTKPELINIWCRIIAVLGFIASAAVTAIIAGLLPDIGGESMRKTLTHLQSESGNFISVFICIAVMLGAIYLARVLKHHKPQRCFGWTSIYILMIYWMVSAVVLPGAMNFKSDKPLAQQIEALTKGENEIYSYRPDRLNRYYTINYYLGDRLRLFEVEMPCKGILLIGEGDLPAFCENIAPDYEFKTLWTSGRRSSESRQLLNLIQFARKETVKAPHSGITDKTNDNPAEKRNTPVSKNQTGKDK